MIHSGNLSGRGPLGLKQPNLVSQPLRDAARGQECTLRLPCCNHDPATVVLCHIRLPGVAGIGEKPDDWFAVFGCHACHDSIDRRNSKNAELWSYDDLLLALHRTIKAQISMENIIIRGAK